MTIFYQINDFQCYLSISRFDPEAGLKCFPKSGSDFDKKMQLSALKRVYKYQMPMLVSYVFSMSNCLVKKQFSIYSFSFWSRHGTDLFFFVNLFF